MLAIRLPFLAVALTTIACSSSYAPDAAPGDDAGAELDARVPIPDAGRDAGHDGGHDAGSPPTDAGSERDGGVDPVTFEAAALREQARARCRCNWMQEEWGSETECAASPADEPAATLDCYRAIHATYGSAFTAPVVCDARARLLEAECLDAMACSPEALAACAAELRDRRAACPGVPGRLEPAIDLAIWDCRRIHSVGPPGGCPESTTPSSALGDAVFAGNTQGHGDDSQPSCVDLEVADVAHLWAPPAPGRYVIDTRGSLLNTVLSVLSGCRGTELACNDDGPGIGLRSSLTIDLLTTDPVVIVVDGVGLDTGPYQVNIRAE